MRGGETGDGGTGRRGEGERGMFAKYAKFLVLEKLAYLVAGLAARRGDFVPGEAVARRGKGMYAKYAKFGVLEYLAKFVA
jgi:hypothetical protein